MVVVVVMVMVRVARAGTPVKWGMGWGEVRVAFRGKVDPATKSRIRLKPNRVPEDPQFQLPLNAAALDTHRSS